MDRATGEPALRGTTGAMVTEGLQGRPPGAASVGVRIVLTVALFAVCAAYLVRPIKDPDFFWHLKTGEWIWEHRQLPASDPFSITGAAVATSEARVILTAYWVSQLLFHLVHSQGGMTGIALLRVAIAVALLFVLWKRLKRDPLVDAALLLVFAVTFLEKYPVERPQVISFVLFALLLVLLDGLRGAASGGTDGLSRARGSWGAPLVSLLMLAWANVHSGFILGQATIMVYLVMEGAKFAHPSLRPVNGETYRVLAVAGIAGILVAFANPNTYHAWQIVFQPGQPAGSAPLIAEYGSTVEMLKYRKDYIVFVIWMAMLLATAAIVTRPRRIDITEAMLVAGSGFYAFMHVRYGAVFLIVALPVIGSFLSQAPWVRLARAFLAAGALVLALLFARDEFRGFERLRTRDWVSRTSLPVEAADFIAANGLRGNIYNYYDWGGYLIWRLGPENKVFVDGRNIDPIMSKQALLIHRGFEGRGQRQWRILLDKYGIDLVLTPYSYRGAPVALVDRLHQDSDWAAVWSNKHSIIFRRIGALRGDQRGPPQVY